MTKYKSAPTTLNKILSSYFDAMVFARTEFEAWRQKHQKQKNNNFRINWGRPVPLDEL